MADKSLFAPWYGLGNVYLDGSSQKVLYHKDNLTLYLSQLLWNESIQLVAADMFHFKFHAL